MSLAIEVLFYAGAIQGFLLAMFLFSVKTNKIANNLLALLTISWGLILLLFPLQNHGLYQKFPHLLETIPQLLFAIFPLLYLYVKYLLADFKSFHKKDFLHFIPLVLNCLLNIHFFFGLSGEEKFEMNIHPTLYYSVLSIIGNEVIALQGIIYSILVLRRINRYQSEILNFDSNADRRILRYLKLGTYLVLASWIVGTIAVNLEILNVSVGVDLFVFVYFIFVIVIYIISYVAIKTPEIFKLEETKMEFGFSQETELKKTERETQLNRESNADQSVLEETNNQLNHLMSAEKLYLNADLNLQILSDRLNTSRNRISKVINKLHNKNFYEFINSYRVEEVKTMMQDPEKQHLKLMSLAYDAGFNSKASFNRAFKSISGETPSAYFEKVKGASKKA